MAVRITGIDRHSPAEKAGLLPEDILLKIGEEEIHDVLDYRFYMTAPRLSLALERGGKPFSLEIRKGEYDDLGLEFETYLMDKQRSCSNHCIFCFIDQNPKGMRKTIYFKDDDDRLSFLFGNYITLTNLTDHDIDRILKMHISPINVSVHTTNPELRTAMLRNPNGGSSLEKLRRLCDGSIRVNTQMVLCPGYNDGEELERSFADLDALVPAIQSICCVPVGLTRNRKYLTPLRPFTQEEAARTIDTIEKYANKWLREYGIRVGYPGDEFFLLAGRPIPDAAYYGEFEQIENGVGLIASTRLEFENLIPLLEPKGIPRTISVATGEAAGDSIGALCRRAMEVDPTLTAHCYPIPNQFFGGKITVTGLVTASDILSHLKGRELGEQLLVPSCMLRKEQDLFLDDQTPAALSAALGIPVTVIAADGAGLAEALIE